MRRALGRTERAQIELVQMKLASEARERARPRPHRRKLFAASRRMSNFTDPNWPRGKQFRLAPAPGRRTPAFSRWTPVPRCCNFPGRMSRARTTGLSAGEAVLGLVIEQPDHGFSLERRLEERFAAARFAYSTAYSALRRLQKDGLVRVVRQTRKRARRSPTRPRRRASSTSATGCARPPALRCRARSCTRRSPCASRATCRA